MVLWEGLDVKGLNSLLIYEGYPIKKRDKMVLMVQPPNSRDFDYSISILKIPAHGSEFSCLPPKIPIPAKLAQSKNPNSGLTKKC